MLNQSKGKKFNILLISQKMAIYLLLGCFLILFFPSCGLAVLFSNDLKGTWQAYDNSNGVRVCREYILSDSTKEDYKLVTPGVDGAKETVEKKSRLIGTYSYNFYEDGKKILKQCSKGTYQLNSDKYIITFLPSDELALVNTYNYMIVNKFLSIDLVSSDKTAIRYTRQPNKEVTK